MDADPVVTVRDAAPTAVLVMLTGAAFLDRLWAMLGLTALTPWVLETPRSSDSELEDEKYPSACESAQDLRSLEPAQARNDL